jgi:hypothetical protein
MNGDPILIPAHRRRESRGTRMKKQTIFIAMAVIGLLIACYGFSWQFRSRTNTQDLYSWIGWSAGMFLIGCGVSLRCSALPLIRQLPIAILVGLATPVVAFALLVVAFWGVIIVGGIIDLL